MKFYGNIDNYILQEYYTPHLQIKDVLKGGIRILEFYFAMFIRWVGFTAVLVYFVIGGQKELKILFKHKLLIFLYILIYSIIFSVFSNMGWVRPFLSESNLKNLELSEGYCSVYYGGKITYVTLDTNSIDSFDFSLCIPFVNKKKIDKQHVKIWHKGRMVYQICKDDEIIFNIDNANQNIGMYNFLVVPLGYLVVMVASLFLELLIIQETMRIKKT